MRVHVSYSTEVDDSYRRAINVWYGKPGLATRDDVKRWLHSYGTSMDDDIMFELSKREEKESL